MKTLKNIQKSIFLILCLLFMINSVAQNDRSILKDKFRFIYVANPNNNNSIILNNEQIYSGNETGSFWTNNNINGPKNLVRALLKDNANGGDPTLQYFAAKIVKIVDKPILVYLYDDVTNALSPAAVNQWKMCLDDPGSATAKAWPCASNQSTSDDFSQSLASCSGESDPGRTDNMWGGLIHLGAHHLNNHPIGWGKGTLIHELVHTQDISDSRFHEFWVNGSNFRYGLDGHHLDYHASGYGIEGVPNLAMAYKEGIANTITLLYDEIIANEYFNWFKNNEALLIEVNPNPRNSGIGTGETGEFLRCLNVISPSPDAWLYDIMTDAGHAALGIINIPSGSTNQYGVFRIRDVAPKFIVHNEFILAMIFSEYAHHISLGRFISALRYSNDKLFRVCASGIAVLFENMCIEGIPPGETLASLSQSQSSITEKKYLLPLAYADYFTSYRSQTKADFEAIFENALPQGWIDLYWDTAKTTVRTAVPMTTLEKGNLTDIAIALGITTSSTED